MYRIKIANRVTTHVAGLMFGCGGDDGATDDGHGHVPGDEGEMTLMLLPAISVWYVRRSGRLLVDRVPLLVPIFHQS